MPYVVTARVVKVAVGNPTDGATRVVKLLRTGDTLPCLVSKGQIEHLEGRGMIRKVRQGGKASPETAAPATSGEA